VTGQCFIPTPQSCSRPCLFLQVPASAANACQTYLIYCRLRCSTGRTGSDGWAPELLANMGPNHMFPLHALFPCANGGMFVISYRRLPARVSLEGDMVARDQKPTVVHQPPGCETSFFALCTLAHASQRVSYSLIVWRVSMQLVLQITIGITCQQCNLPKEL
jgi:hypothetical protein